MFIDSHAHLDMDEFKDDLDAVIKRAQEAKIENIITIGASYRLEENHRAVEIAEEYPFVYASVGIHPHEAKIFDDKVMSEIEKLSEHKKVVAVGEIGLDFFHNLSPRKKQIETFKSFIRLAGKVRLPVIIHSREANDETMRILKEEKAGDAGGVIHCFSGDIKMAREALDLGFYLSFTGVVTFPKAFPYYAEIIKEIPLEAVLIETDAPYLAPIPFRGKRNEPAYVVKVAEKIAEIKDMTVEDIARITTLNAKTLFSLPGAAKEGKIAYKIRNSLYLNITNRCTNACEFCPKFKDYMVKGHYLKLKKEPSVDEILSAIDKESGFNEVVFCGYGEPTLRLEVLKEIAKALKERGCKTRLNTDGQANLIYGRNILPELKGLIDVISITLNSPDEEHYIKHHRSRFRGKGYNAVKDFIKEAKIWIPEVMATALDMPDTDIKKVRDIVEYELGVKFRLRKFNQVG